MPFSRHYAGRDPFLIAYCMADGDRCVVTTEVSKPRKKRQNRKVPDVCNCFAIACCIRFRSTGHWASTLHGSHNHVRLRSWLSDLSAARGPRRLRFGFGLTSAPKSA
jgi:hypothetical protein